MKHLVTGGSGFLGRLIASHLLTRGDAVTILDIWDAPDRPRDIEFVHCDIRNPDGVAKALRSMDVVHHAAALVPLSKSGRDFWDVNVTGTRVVAEAAARAGVRSFVHMSSSAVFGAPAACPITETTPTIPIEVYGRAKLAAEHTVKEVMRSTDTQLLIIRPRTILGEGRLGIFEMLFRWTAENRVLYIVGRGEQAFQFVHARDLIDLYVLALDRGKSGTWNVGTNRFGTFRAALETLIAHARSTSVIRSLPEALAIPTLRILDYMHLSPLAPWHYMTSHKPFVFDGRDTAELGWLPRYSNDEMIRASYDWFIENKPLHRRHTAGSPHRRSVREGILGLLRSLS